MVLVRTSRGGHLHRPARHGLRMFTPPFTMRAGLLVVVWVATSHASHGQSARSISLGALDVPYRQDFDTLAASGASGVLPIGWLIAESGDLANTTYSADAGSGDASDTYSFGASGSPERALGVLESTRFDAAVGALFTNDTGAPITSLEIAYTGEQWRRGSLGRRDRLTFFYAHSTKSLTEGRWVRTDALDFGAPSTRSEVGAHDGNQPGNRRTLRSIVTGLNIPPGVTFGVRWEILFSADHSDGLAVDDFSLTPRGGAPLSGYYTGTLRDFRYGVNKWVSEAGTLAVGLSLCVDGSAVRGSYFYLPVGADIALRGTLATDGTFELDETTPTGAITGRWSGRLEHTLAGIWTSPKGDRHPFALVKAGLVPADSTVAGQARTGAPPCSDVGYRMARVSPKRPDYFPRLVRFADAEIMARVSSLLDLHAGFWFEELDGDARDSCDLDSERAAEVGVMYAARDVLSIRAVGNVECGGRGGVPSGRDDSLTFDLRSGDLVPDVTGLFKPGTAWKEVFSVLFAYQIAEAGGSDGECMRQYNHENLEPSDVAFHLSPDGLVVAPSTYGLISPVHHCEQVTVVPFAAVRGLADPKGVLARVAGEAMPAEVPRYRIRDWRSDEGVEIVFETPGRPPR